MSTISTTGATLTPMQRPTTAATKQQSSREYNLFLGAQTSLLKDKEVRIYYNPKEGLLGTVCDLKSGKVSDLLPLVDVPAQLISMNDLGKLIRFFSHTYINPKTDMHGTYNALKVGIKAPGGVDQKIPFQPGLALGSIVRGSVIEKMNDYAESMAIIENVQKQMRSLEQGLGAIGAKIESLAQKITPDQQPADASGGGGKAKDKSVDQLMLGLFEMQKQAIVAQMKAMPAQLKKIKDLTLPLFSNMTTGIKSPIDFDRTQTVTDSRGFDSMNYNSQYIDMSESSQRISDKMDQSSSASEVSASVSVGGFFGKFKASASHSWASGAMNRVADIRNQGHASKVLVMNALVTTRNVKCLRNQSYNLYELGQIRDLMKSNDDAKELDKLGISVMPNGEKAIYMLTEAVMGGSFSAIVTFLKEDISNRKLRDSAKHSSSATKGSAGYSGWGVKASGSYARSQQNASEQSDDQIHNQGNTNVTIEFIAQGAIPQLSRDTVVREALKYKNQQLRTYQSSGSQSEGQSVHSRQAEMQKAMYATMNTVQETKTKKESTSLHTANSVMQAYDDFCGEITSDPESGVPIGFNYSILTEKDITTILERFEKTQAAQAAAVASANSDAATGGE
ncbi:hypothetical protein COB21_05990 [Candidatus Aerophobetes bacterium]|uniref:Uncharacterized protein n=1 Tax=Aerophobetes bacterium TaxID=2030807 RepID=A0A2A4WZB4_UNCAE|nr:MAG: hypothetical protein COB21_05990 [Candidatus Aerophobetes bacterium]